MLPILKRPKPKLVTPVTVPAPSLGLDVSSPLAEMDQRAAVYLNNWVVQPNGVWCRRGWAKRNTGCGVVTGIHAYHGTGVEKLFAANTVGSVYDITVPGAVGTAAVSGMSNGDCQSILVSNSGGTFLLVCNGADLWRRYNGTVWYQNVAGDFTVASGAPNPSTAVDFALHQRRLWFVPKNSMVAGYLAPDAIQGAVSKYDFGPLFSRGGSIAKITTWSVDSGSGMDDKLVVITTAGEVAVFSGVDPNSASTWSLDGVYHAAPPAPGHRFVLRDGGDCVLLTTQGALSLRQLLASGSGISGKLGVSGLQLSSALAQVSNTEFAAWQIEKDDASNLVVVNVPASAIGHMPKPLNGGTMQLAMHYLVGALSTFTGVPATCWCSAPAGLLFGGDGFVAVFGVGMLDDTAPIVCEALQSFTKFGKGDMQGLVQLFKVNLLSTGTPAARGTIAVDYNTQQQVPPTIQYSTDAGNIWGSGIWGTAAWAGAAKLYGAWSAGEGSGYSFAVHIAVSPSGSTCWADTAYQIQPMRSL